MAENVLFDPQFSVQKILKPFRDFEGTYQGQPGTIPIAFFEDPSKPRDPDAGKAGFGGNLLNYIDVPFGAVVAVWFPMAYYATETQVFVGRYRYRVKWRMRNVTDYRNRRIPYHLNKQFPGAPDSSDVGNPQRLIIPAAFDDIELQQPTPPAGPVDFLLRPRAYSPPAWTELLDTLPLLPGGALGVHQQGIFDPSTFGVGADVVRNAMFFPPKLFLARGDQMIIEGLKTEVEQLNPWNFATDDITFGKIFGAGSPEGSGIYVFTGVTPHQD